VGIPGTEIGPYFSAAGNNSSESGICSCSQVWMWRNALCM